MRQKPPDRGPDHEKQPGRSSSGLFFRCSGDLFVQDQGIGLAAAVTGKQAVFLQIAFALGGKVGMADLFGDAGTKILGQMQADGVFYIAPEKKARLLQMEGLPSWTMQPLPSRKKMQ